MKTTKNLQNLRRRSGPTEDCPQNKRKWTKKILLRFCCCAEELPDRSELVELEVFGQTFNHTYPHPPYSPDLAPNTLLYSKFKMKLKGRKFNKVDMIQTESKETLRNISKYHFISCFDNWKKDGTGLPCHKKHAAGLFNQGNTCYSNAVVQCMAHTAPILKECCKEFSQDMLNTDSINGGLILKRFGMLLKAIWSEERAFCPIEFQKQVGMVEEKFGNNTQQDPMEFLQYLLQELHEDFNRTTESPEITEKTHEAHISWQIYLNQESSPIVDTFAGQIISTRCCQFCQNISENYEIFKDLSLAIHEKECPSLMGCLKEHFKTEVLDDFTCSNCGTKNSIKKYGVTQWPRILTLQLKRFSAFELAKIKKMVDCPTTLDLSQFGSEAKYKLYAFVNHFGSLDTGHCTAACRHPTTNQWYYYNDDSVSKISKDVNTADAYILFYEKML
ncbi:USP2 [Cordylochernes scorpioides]|uniref:ubiquitinyl hydrolase 1 n=1 Tax=Cordylochernes scorpioides TaxID=51811 RepID=A0ABY6KYB8_9ARAC|nr:USP2 [Cordylochernes scorpioides]